MRRLWAEQPGLHRGYLIDVFTAVAVALALILGGRDRTVARVFATLNESGGPVAWGLGFAAVAALRVAATFVSGRAMMLALWAGAACYGLLGSWFLQAALSESTASFIGVVYSFYVAGVHLSRGDAYRAGPAT